MASQWYVYIIETVNGKLYTGITTDVERRFEEHRAGGNKGAKFFRSNPAKRVAYQELADNRSEASKRESSIKKLTRADKIQLINQGC